MKKISLFLLAMFVLMGTLSIPVGAVLFDAAASSEDAEMTLLMNNGAVMEANFAITDSGEGYIAVYYAGLAGVCRQITVKVAVQKRMDETGLWQDVALAGQKDGRWVIVSDKTQDHLFFRFSLAQGGTYRAVVEVRFSGSGGADDVVSSVIERRYAPVSMGNLSAEEPPASEPEMDTLERHWHDGVLHGACGAECSYFGCSGDPCADIAIAGGFHLFLAPVYYSNYTDEDGTLWHKRYQICDQCGEEVYRGEVKCTRKTSMCKGGCQA